MTSSNLLVTHIDMGAFVNENSLWYPRYDTSVVEAHCKIFYTKPESNTVNTLETFE